MSQDEHMETAVMLVGLVLLGAFLAHNCDAQAQDYTPPPVDSVFPVPTARAVFLLSRIAYHETDGRSPLDHAAIHEVLRNKAERYSVALVPFMRRYAPRATCTRDCTGRRAPRGLRTAWIQQLQPAGWRPALYAESLPWGYVRRRWLRVMDYSRRLLMGWERSACSAPPIDWGCETRGCNDTPGYLRHHPRACRVDCGPTVNVFWRPSGGC